MYIKNEERIPFTSLGMAFAVKKEFIDFINKYPNSVSIIIYDDKKDEVNIYLNITRINKKDLHCIQDCWFAGFLVTIDSIKLFHITQTLAHFKISIEDMKKDYSELISKTCNEVDNDHEYELLDNEVQAFTTIILKSKVLFDEIKEQTKVLVEQTMEIFEREILIPYIRACNDDTNINEFGIHIKLFDQDDLIFLIEIYYNGLSHIDKLKHNRNWEQIKQFANNIINIRKNSIFYGDTFKECFMTDKYRIFNFSSTSISFQYTLGKDFKLDEE